MYWNKIRYVFIYNTESSLLSFSFKHCAVQKMYHVTKITDLVLFCLNSKTPNWKLRRYLNVLSLLTSIITIWEKKKCVGMRQDPMFSNKEQKYLQIERKLRFFYNQKLKYFENWSLQVLFELEVLFQKGIVLLLFILFNV
jgi:hypothetical protein